MDLVFKEWSSWDLTELDFDVLDDTSNNQNMEVFSIHPTSGKPNDQKHSTISASSKKQHISCLVDGCTADLTRCRDYHRRHRVCETHSKTPLVIIGGKDQRFCQQCSRFHSVGEFDEVKRSCRKRLDGHNRRRRKPRAESMYLNYGSFSTNHQGTKLLRFGGSPEYTLRWPHTEKLKQQVHVSVQQTTPSNPCTRLKFPFLLEFPERLVEPKAALSLLSKHTMNHLPLRNVRDGDTNNHSEGLLEDDNLYI